MEHQRHQTPIHLFLYQREDFHSVFFCFEHARIVTVFILRGSVPMAADLSSLAQWRGAAGHFGRAHHMLWCNNVLQYNEKNPAPPMTMSIDSEASCTVEQLLSVMSGNTLCSTLRGALRSVRAD